MEQLFFSFVDEAGLLRDPKQPELGVGALTVHDNHLALNQKLRNVFLAAVTHLGAIEERFEFKFTHVTKGSFPFHNQLLDIMSEYKDSWSFTWIVEKRGDRDFWSHYLDVLDRLFTGNNQAHIVLADHLNKPRKAKRGLSDLEGNTIRKVLQLESQGSVLLQVADIFLGAVMFEHRGGKDECKAHIAKRVIELLT